jgi:adenylyltransferase/sulfurtransferase
MKVGNFSWALALEEMISLFLRRFSFMAVKVIIPTPLRVYAGKRDSAEFTARTVGEALGRLTTEYADLRKHLFTEDGKLRSFVNVYVNDEDIRYLAKENTPTKDGDTISIIPSIAGGCCFSPCCPCCCC